MATIEQKLGRRIAALRRRVRMTQADLAEASGYSDDFIGLVERGINAPSVSGLERIARALNVPLKDLFELKWQAGIAIPRRFQVLGRDIDFGKEGVLVEIQFSNYPFLLNNLLRCELLYKSQDKVLVLPKKMEVAVIVTKAGMFPASNSTLYYEQAEKQLTALAGEGVFTVPLRLVGLFEELDKDVRAARTRYKKRRYSRRVVTSVEVTVRYQKRVVPELKKGTR